MDNQSSMIPNPEIVQPTHNMNPLILLPQTGITVANTPFNYQSMISNYDFPVGNQQDFQLLESDLPYLEYFLNNPIPDIHQRPDQNISYPGELMISQIYNNQTKVMNKMGFNDLKLDSISQNKLIGLGINRDGKAFFCAECRISFPTSQALGGHKSHHAKLLKKSQSGRIQPPPPPPPPRRRRRRIITPPENMVEHPAEEPPLKHRRIID